MTIQLWNYSKKHNSTARPTTTAALELNIVLKQHTSINNPVFILRLSTYPNYNYIYWVDVNQYYYVSDIVSYNNDMWELHCEIDDLATARPYILNSDAFVKYSTINFNEYLKDDRIIPTCDITADVSRLTLSAINTGYSTATTMWILTTFSKEDGLCSYAVNWNNIYYLTKKLTEDGSSIWGSIEQLFGDAKGSIIDLRLTPFTQAALQSADVIADNSTRIYLGDYDTLQDGFRVNQYLYEIADTITFTMPSNFTRCSPYTEAKLFLPLIGTVDISLDELTHGSIGFIYTCNIATGNVVVKLRQATSGQASATRRIIATYSGNCSFSVPLAFQQINGLNAIAATSSAIAGLASGGAMTVAGIAGAVAGMASAFRRTTSTTNSFSGNFIGSEGNEIRLVLFKHGLSEEPENMTTLYGRPCGKVLNMSELVNGYVECSQFELAAPFDDEIITRVNNHMNSGVYLY